MVISANEQPDQAGSKITGASAWLPAVRIYLAIIAVGNLLWEAAHLPLYTIWTAGTMREQAKCWEEDDDSETFTCERCGLDGHDRDCRIAWR